MTHFRGTVLCTLLISLGCLLFDASARPPILADWTDDEMSVLRERDLDTTPPSAVIRLPQVQREPTRRPDPELQGKAEYHRYVFNNGEEVPIDSSLAPLVFLDFSEGEVKHLLLPQVQVQPVEAYGERQVVYYFEFDVVETFDSPNFWRYPQLLPFQPEEDATGRAGTRYRIFRTGTRDPVN